MVSNLCLNDDSMGPGVQGCRGDFDFTLAFESTLFGIIPAGFFVLLSLARLAYLLPKPKIVSALAFRLLKLAIILVLIGLQFSLVFVFSLGGGRGDGLKVTATILSFFASLTMAILSSMEHSRSLRPSILLNGYTFLTLLFDIAQTRTYWLMARNTQRIEAACLYTASVLVKAVLLFLEAWTKTEWIRGDVGHHSPEESSNIFSLGLYAWLNRLLLRGYLSLLSIDSLYYLDKAMTAEATSSKLDGYWGNRNSGVVRNLTRSLAIPLLLPVVPRGTLIAFSYCQPFFIHALLEHLQRTNEGTAASDNASRGLIGASALIYAGSLISSALYSYYQLRAVYMLRSCLCGAIYKKTTERGKHTTGDSDASGANLTLMNTDTERTVRGLYPLHEFWASTLEIGIGLWLLQRQVKGAFLASIITALICFVMLARTACSTPKRQRIWMSKMQTRVALTANVISNMKCLKMNGIIEPAADFIQELRAGEVLAGSRWRELAIITATLANVPITITPAIVFAFLPRSPDAALIFTSLSYLVLLARPLNSLFQSVPQIHTAFICLGRIQRFLDSESRVEFRRFGCTSEAGDIPNSNIDSEVKSSAEKQAEALGESNTSGKSPPAVAITLSSGSFGWVADRMVLKDVNLTIYGGRLTVVTGPVSSGKSTLCKALLGEVPVAHGELRLSGSCPRVGFCDQTPFLLNATFKDNIIGYSPFDQQRYQNVLEATMLNADVDSLLDRHDANIGSNGCTLSGGQKQRLALARALYTVTDFLVIDDILGCLDNDTHAEVFRRVFGPDGILRKRKATVVLCSNSPLHLLHADYVIDLSAEGIATREIAQNFERRDGSITKNQSMHHSIRERAPETTRPNSQISSGLAVPRAPGENWNPSTRKNGDWKAYRYYFASTGIIAVVLLLLSGLSFSVSGNFSTVWLRYWAENTLQRPDGIYIGVFALLRSFQLICFAGGCTIVLLTMTRISGTELHKKTLATVTLASLHFLTATDPGTILNLFSNDLTLIDGELPIALINLCFNGFDALGMAAIIASASPYLTAGYPILFLVLYVLQKFYLRTSRQLRLLDLEAKSPLYSHFLDTTSGIVTIRAFGWVRHQIEYNNHLVDTSQRPAYLLAMIQQWLALTLRVIVMIMAVVTVTLATHLNADSALTGASLVTIMTFSSTITSIIQMYTQLETSIGAVSRLKAFNDRVPQESSTEDDIVPPDHWPERGAIEISGVSASYSGSPQNIVIKDITMSILPGERVAICGKTGSGKSSVLLLLIRLLEPLQPCLQNIFIDGVPLHRLDRSSLRKRIIVLSQDPVFLDGNTLRANLDPSNTVSDEVCREVLETVQLASLFKGRDALRRIIRTDSLSAGQQRLFALGRAIIRRRLRSYSSSTAGGILLLDEINFAGDGTTQEALQSIIKQEFAGYTILMVCHQLDMVVNLFDRVIVMENGRVAETGNPSELAKEARSRFGRLWRLQATDANFTEKR